MKRFGSTTALDHLDLAVAPGEVHGFLGPNGAGKTVTMRIILGLLRPDGGTAEVFGHDPWADAVSLHRRIAYVPGETNLWPNLTGGEILDVLGGLHGGFDAARRAELIDQYELDPTKKARSYSKGNRQKVALIAALASDADLLVLDEPTTGLDPLMEAVFRHHITEARAAGRAVLLSSHVLAEVEKLCDRVTIIRRGRTVQSGSLDELRHLTRTTMVAHTDTDPSSLASVPWVHHLQVERIGGEHQARFEVDSDDLTMAARALADLGLRALESHPPTLEELFLRHYGDELDRAQVDHEHDGHEHDGAR